MKNMLKNTINALKGYINIIGDYYKSLTPIGKMIFILIVIICKLGPDMITIPLLIKWINKKNAQRNKVELS